MTESMNDQDTLVCPYCQNTSNHAFQTSGRMGRSPQAGEPSICGSCLNVSQFALTDDAFHLVPLDVETLEPAFRDSILAQIDAVRQHHASFRLH